MVDILYSDSKANSSHYQFKYFSLLTRTRYYFRVQNNDIVLSEGIPKCGLPLHRVSTTIAWDVYYDCTVSTTNVWGVDIPLYGISTITARMSTTTVWGVFYHCMGCLLPLRGISTTTGVSNAIWIFLSLWVLICIEDMRIARTLHLYHSYNKYCFGMGDH